MTEENHLALIVALFLSKFDAAAYKILGYGNWKEAFIDIGERLSANPNTVKNMRDQFDPIYENSRVGWYQRPLLISRVRAIEEFGSLSFEAFAMLVRSILQLEQGVFQLEKATQFLNQAQPQTPEQVEDEPFFTTRGKTGRLAENYFLELFHAGQLPFQGELTDRRDDGCGFDFLIRGREEHAVEVKGLKRLRGNLLFTNREWETAQKISLYSVFLASNLGAPKGEWEQRIIPSPQLIGATQTVQTVVQVNWCFTPQW